MLCTEVPAVPFLLNAAALVVMAASLVMFSLAPVVEHEVGKVPYYRFLTQIEPSLPASVMRAQPSVPFKRTLQLSSKQSEKHIFDSIVATENFD